MTTSSRMLTLGALLAIAAAACTLTPPADNALSSATQAITYSGFSPLAATNVTVQLQDCRNGAWVDVATTTTASVPTIPKTAKGAAWYAWSVTTHLPPLDPVWCSNIYSFRWIVTRAVHPSGAVLNAPGRPDGLLVNYCFPNYCS